MTKQTGVRQKAGMRHQVRELVWTTADWNNGTGWDDAASWECKGARMRRQTGITT